jgi:hypothetical protein
MSINAVFGIGGKRTPAIDIFLWANEPQVGYVSKLFREVHLKIVEPEARKIRNAAIQQNQLPLPDPIPNGLSIRQFLEAMVHAVAQQVDTLFPVLAAHFRTQNAELHTKLDSLWNQMVQVNNRLLDAPDVPAARLHFYLNVWRVRLRNMQDLMRYGNQYADAAVAEFNILASRIREGITRENLMWRFRLIQGQQEPNLSHLGALARTQQANILRDVAAPRIGYDRYSFDRFLQGEQRILSTELEKDKALCKFTSRIRFPAAAAPPVPLQASRIRDFLQDPARAVHERGYLQIFDLPFLNQK